MKEKILQKYIEWIKQGEISWTYNGAKRLLEEFLEYRKKFDEAMWEGNRS